MKKPLLILSSLICMCAFAGYYQHKNTEIDKLKPQSETTIQKTPPVEPKLTAYQKLLLANERQQSIRDAEQYSYESEFEQINVQSPNDIKCGNMLFDKKLVKSKQGNNITLSFDGDEITVACTNN